MNTLVPPLRLGHGLPLLAAFEEAQAQGWITSQTVSDRCHSIRLFNYTKQCTYQRHWDDVTLNSRGLAVDPDTGIVEMLSLTKFFNLGEIITPGVRAIMPPGPLVALAKMDGAWGGGYRFNDEIRISTRGSFHSLQAQVAQDLWNTKYAQHNHLFFDEWFHLTPMVEIIHPETRQVVRYHFEDLVLIAVRNRFTGEDLSHDELLRIGQRLGMPVVERVPSDTIEGVLARVEQMDDNEEGVVMWQPGRRVRVPRAQVPSSGWAEPDQGLAEDHSEADYIWTPAQRTKSKGKAYKEMHALLSDVTPRRLALRWYDGTIDSLLVMIPEEFREASEREISELDLRVMASLHATEAAYAAAPPGDRQAFAQWVNTQPANLKGFLFGRFQSDATKSTMALVANALAKLIDARRLGELPSVWQEEVQEAISAYEKSVGAYLWEETRTPEGCGRLSRLAQRLPKQLRGYLVAAIEGLQPALMEKRIRAFVEEERAVIGELSVDQLMASAPSPEAPLSAFVHWTQSKPGVLRSLLERWNRSRRYQTAFEEARVLLASAVAAGAVRDLLEVLSPALATVPEVADDLLTLLSALQGELQSVWQVLCQAQDSGPEVMLDKAKAFGLQEPWAMALLNAAWDAHRRSVRDAYIAEGRRLSFSDRLDEES